MSSTEETELKAGHAPAVKAGGMRVVSRPRNTSTGESKPETKEEEDVASTPPKGEKHNFQVNLSGAIGQGDKDFTPDAVKSYHDKPLPSKDNRHAPKQQHHIQQPK